MDNHYYGFPTHLKELSDSENKILKRETVKAVNHTYGDTIQKVKYLDYRHKIQRQRERELSKQKKEQERIRLEKAKSRAAVYKSAKRYGRNFIGIVPLLIIVTFVWFIAGTYDQVTKQVTVGDQVYEYEMITPESANAIGGRAFDFIDGLFTGLGSIGESSKQLFVNDNGEFSGGIISILALSINKIINVITGGIDIISTTVNNDHAGYTREELNALIQWELDNGYMNYFQFIWFGLKSNLVKLSTIDDINELGWTFHPDNPHLHENQVPEEE